MPAEEYSDKLKSLKTKSKKSSRIPPKQLRIALVLVVSVIVVFEVYNIYFTAKNREVEELTYNKEVAIDTIDKLFFEYPNDPQKISYIIQVQQSSNKNDISKILSEVRDYLQIKRYKALAVDQIKSMYGEYYRSSLKANELERKINDAKTTSEVDTLFKQANVEEEIKEILERSLQRTIGSGDNYFYVKMAGQSYFMTKENVLDITKSMGIMQLKEFTITPVSNLNKLTVTVSSKQCGKMPLSGDSVLIYNKNTPESPMGYAIIDSSYVILPNIGYSEERAVSNKITDDDVSSNLETTSSISYSLNNLPGVLHATAADKLDIATVNEKFGRYGEKLNKISENTQIFDENVKYMLIIAVPSESVSAIVSQKSEDLYIVKAAGGN
ncbi:DUF515 domain-containing protein [Methanococcus vannielii]|nr:DUF515 domain-containing protein [Methanococcus vannielii]